LHFENVVLLLSEVLQEFELGGTDNSYDRAVFFESLKSDFNGFLFLFVFLGVFGESFFLTVEPVFVESSESVFVEFLSPDSGQSSESSRGIDISDQSDDNHGRGFDDGDSLDGFFLVQFGSWFFDFSQDVGHSGLEPSESCEVARFFLVVFRE